MAPSSPDPPMWQPPSRPGSGRARPSCQVRARFSLTGLGLPRGHYRQPGRRDRVSQRDGDLLGGFDVQPDLETAPTEGSRRPLLDKRIDLYLLSLRAGSRRFVSIVESSPSGNRSPHSRPAPFLVHKKEGSAAAQGIRAASRHAACGKYGGIGRSRRGRRRRAAWKQGPGSLGPGARRRDSSRRRLRYSTSDIPISALKMRANQPAADLEAPRDASGVQRGVLREHRGGGRHQPPHLRFAAAAPAGSRDAAHRDSRSSRAANTRIAACACLVSSTGTPRGPVVEQHADGPVSGHVRRAREPPPTGDPGLDPRGARPAGSRRRPRSGSPSSLVRRKASRSSRSTST